LFCKILHCSLRKTYKSGKNPSSFPFAKELKNKPLPERNKSHVGVFNGCFSLLNVISSQYSARNSPIGGNHQEIAFPTSAIWRRNVNFSLQLLAG
jgi:hypothetical protein